MSEGIVLANDGLADILRQVAEKLDENQRRQDETSREMATVKSETSREMATVKSELRNVRDEIDGIKDNQYVEPWQADNIQRAAKARAAELLGIRWENGVVADECIEDYKRYYGKFIRLIHNDAKKRGLEIGKIVYTPRRNYEMLLEFIGEWRPVRGVEGQKRYYDKLAEIGG